VCGNYPVSSVGANRLNGDDAVNDPQHLARDQRAAGEEKTQLRVMPLCGPVLRIERFNLVLKAEE